MAPGDLLIAFTDGVTEAGQAEDVDLEYGDERLERLAADKRDLPPEELACAIAADIDDFVGDAARTDDITMVIIKRNE